MKKILNFFLLFFLSNIFFLQNKINAQSDLDNYFNNKNKEKNSQQVVELFLEVEKLKKNIRVLAGKLEKETFERKKIAQRLEKIEQLYFKLSLDKSTKVDNKSNENFSSVGDSKIDTDLEKAILNFQKDKYNNAIISFNNFIANYNNVDYLDDAYYWLARSYYAKGDYLTAIKVYQKIIQTFSDSDKLPLTHYRLSLTYSMINNKQKAIYYLKEFIKKFPEDKLLAIIKQELKLLNN